jgi:hypothetical protein
MKTKIKKMTSKFMNIIGMLAPFDNFKTSSFESVNMP